MRRRIDAAIAFRESLGIDATAYRLVHGEADLLPSLIVDRYGDYLVVQALSQGMDRLLPVVVDGADRAAAAARHPGAQRSAGARCSKASSSGSTCSPARCPTRVRVTEPGVRLRRRSAPRPEDRPVPRSAREPRRRAPLYARGRLLDCFSYNGGFALALAPQCDETIAFDISEDAVARDPRRTRRATASPSTRASATSSTSCAGSSASASASTRSCSIRRPSPRTRPRSPRRAPATRRSTSAR